MQNVIRYSVYLCFERKEIIFMKMKRPQTRGGVQEEDHINLKEQKIFNLILFMLLYELFSLFFTWGKVMGEFVFFYEMLNLKELFSYRGCAVFFLSF